MSPELTSPELSTATLSRTGAATAPVDEGGIFAVVPPRHRHLARYLAIGVTASAIDVALFVLLYNVVGTSTLTAHSVAVPASVLFSFFVNARHNFRTSDHMALRLFSFIVVCTIGYLAGFGVIVLADRMGVGSNAGKILSLPVVFVIQFVLNSRITFRKASSPAAA